MREFKVKFKVSMDNEQKELKNFDEVTTVIELPDNLVDDCLTAGIAKEVIRLQGRVRPNWSTYKKEGFPARVTFGQALWGGGTKTVVRAPTQAEQEAAAKQEIGNMSEAGIAFLVKEGKFPPKDVAEYWK